MSETTAEAPVWSDEARDSLARLDAELGDAILEREAMAGDPVVRIAPDAWRRAAIACKEVVGCDYLSFVSAIDWMPAPVIGDEGAGDTSTPAQPREQTWGLAGGATRFQLLACVESTRAPFRRIVLKCDVDDTMRAESWVAVYPGADWHERETWEMFGIAFDGHPSLRHLYLPAEFEGNPLRKDFPLLAREVKPWPGLVDVEGMPGSGDEEEAAE